MIASLLFIILAILLGFTILRWVKSPFSLTEQLLWGIPIGISFLTMATFLLALLLPNQDWAIMTSVIISSIIISYRLNMDTDRKNLFKEVKHTLANLKINNSGYWLAAWFPWFIYTSITVPTLLFWRDGNLITGWINTWGDWAVHLRTSTFFAEHTKLTLDSPLYSGTTFHYPYLSAYLSAILQRLGLDLAQSLTWPTWLLFATLPAWLYSLGINLTKNKLASLMLVYFFLLNGGGGVLYLIKDLFTGNYFWLGDAYNLRLYTDMFRVDGLSTNQSIWFMNFIMSEFFPQRAFLAGIGPALFALLIAWKMLEEKISRQTLILTGTLLGILPIIHAHSFIALGLILPTLWLVKLLNWSDLKLKLLEITWLILPAILIGAIVLFSFIFNPLQAQSFTHLIRWWVPQPDLPVNPVSYWFLNAGPLIVLTIISLAKRKQPYLALIISGGLLFIVCNLISFQPWNYDNLKILTYWYLLWLIPITVMISTFLTSAKKAYLPLAYSLTGLVIISSTGAGLADALSVTKSGLSGGLQLASKSDVEYAKAVNRYTRNQEKALIVAATNHDNPLSLVAGRQLYMGYEGWLWTYGQDWSGRFEEIKQMYAATDTGLALIKANNINYIELGPQERDRFNPDEEKLRSLFPTVVKGKNYSLLKVP